MSSAIVVGSTNSSDISVSGPSRSIDAFLVEHELREPDPPRHVDRDLALLVGAEHGRDVDGHVRLLTVFVSRSRQLVAAVRVDDVLHDAVAHDVARAELDEHEAVDAVEHVAHLQQPRAVPAVGQVDLGRRRRSPRHFEPKPRRVRNIFICSGVVFCASSRMMNESFSVRPRMYASGATSIVPRSIKRATTSGSSMS